MADPCAEKRCKKPGVIRDDDTFLHYCEIHQQGVRHQDCGCEYDLRTKYVVEWCSRHWKIQARIIKLATGRRPKKKPTKAQLQALAIRKGRRTGKVINGEFLQEEASLH